MSLFTKASASRGFSLIEVMISMAVASFVSLGITYALVTSIDGMSHLRNMGLVEDATALLRGMLTDSNYCNLHFKGRTVSGGGGIEVEKDIVFKVMATPMALGTDVVIGKGSAYQGTVMIDSLRLISDSKIGENRYVGSLVADYTVNNGLLSKFQRKVFLFIDVDSSNKIVNCGKTVDSVTVSTTYVRGQHYGSCVLHFDANWNIQTSSMQTWPIVNCPNSGMSSPVCDTGFTVSLDSYMQSNTRHSGDIGSLASSDPRVVLGFYADGDAYVGVYSCVKN